MAIQIQGILEVFVLKKASFENITGSMIVNKIYELTEENWKPSSGTIYPLLSKLAKKGFLKKYKKGKRIFYKITVKGKKELKKEIDYISDDFTMQMCNMEPIFAYLYGVKVPKGFVKLGKKWMRYLIKNPKKWEKSLPTIIKFMNFLGKK